MENSPAYFWIPLLSATLSIMIVWLISTFMNWKIGATILLLLWSTEFLLVLSFFKTYGILEWINKIPEGIQFSLTRSILFLNVIAFLLINRYNKRRLSMREIPKK